MLAKLDEHLMTSSDNPPLLTRKAAVRYVNSVLGVPLKLSTYNKLAMKGETPPPKMFYGRTELHDQEVFGRWALQKLCTNQPNKLIDETT